MLEVPGSNPTLAYKDNTTLKKKNESVLIRIIIKFSDLNSAFKPFFVNERTFQKVLRR